LSLDNIPRRILLDTCILNHLYDEGGYIWDGEAPSCTENLREEIDALRNIFLVNERAHFQFVISPLTVAEIANIQGHSYRHRLLSWVLDVLDHWLIMVDEHGDRVADGGTVRHRFKLPTKLQDFETQLMQIADFRRDPFDRLLLVQYVMGACDAFLTTDRDTIWRHRDELAKLDVRVLRPTDYWTLLRPWAALWR
jgi:hypothetical protein